MRARRRFPTVVLTAFVSSVFLDLACGGSSPDGGGGNGTGPTTMELLAGNNQTGITGRELPEPVVVRVVDAAGNAVQGQIINFKVTLGSGTVFAGSAISNAEGIARERWTLGGYPGPQELEARAVDSSTGAAIVFATIKAMAVDAFEQLTLVSGGEQSGVVGVNLPQVVVVLLSNLEGAPVPGQTISIRVNAGGGTISSANPATGADGRAQVSWTLGTAAASVQEIQFTTIDPVGGRVVGPLVVRATAVPGPAASLSADFGDNQTGSGAVNVGALVKDAYGNLVDGAFVSFAPGVGSGSADPPTATTAGGGKASTAWTAGMLVGDQTLVAGVVGATAFTFHRNLTFGQSCDGAWIGTRTLISGYPWPDCTKGFVMTVTDGEATSVEFPSGGWAYDPAGSIASDGTINWSMGTHIQHVGSGLFLSDGARCRTASGSGSVSGVYMLDKPCAFTWTATRQ